MPSTKNKVTKHNTKVTRKNAKSPGWSERKETTRSGKLKPRIRKAIRKGGY